METPHFTGNIRNVTVAIGREAILSCTVTELGHYKVKKNLYRDLDKSSIRKQFECNRSHKFRDFRIESGCKKF